MRNGIGIGLGAALLLALAGCGEKQGASGNGVTVSTEDIDAALERMSAEENARSQVTMVDAATGDARAMPGDWDGPTAFDMRGTENETAAKKPEEPDEKPKSLAAVRPAPSAEEAFPSVAE